MSDAPLDQSTGPDAGATHVDSVAEFEETLDSNDRVLVDFYADWCGPCLRMADRIETLGTQATWPVLTVDVEALPQLPARYDVRSIPTFLVFEDGEPVDRYIGMQETADLQDALDG